MDAGDRSADLIRVNRSVTVGKLSEFRVDPVEVAPHGADRFQCTAQAGWSNQHCDPAGRPENVGQGNAVGTGAVLPLGFQVLRNSQSDCCFSTQVILPSEGARDHVPAQLQLLSPTTWLANFPLPESESTTDERQESRCNKKGSNEQDRTKVVGSAAAERRRRVKF